MQHLAVLAALRVNRPVKAKLTRQESINFHPKRHYMEGTFTLGCDENGIFTGLDCEIHFDTGAYASLCGPVLERACTHSVGPYCYQNTDIPRLRLVHQQPLPAPSGASACARVSSPWSPTSTCWRKSGHLPWEIRFPQRHRAGEGPPQRPDCRLLHRPQGRPCWR